MPRNGRARRYNPAWNGARRSRWRLAAVSAWRS